ncbi:8343_t:CDS:2 [Entrophospora sp. SA101]|nr:8343_t:CDS:2 [Entrophospora sp. SA101]
MQKHAEITYYVVKAWVKFLDLQNQNLYRDLKKVQIYLNRQDCYYHRIEQLFSLTIYNNNTLINLDVTKSILLFGPSGSGKTHIIHELSDKFNVKLITITIGDLSSEFPLELEKGLDQYFSMCSKNQPSVYDTTTAATPTPATTNNNVPTSSTWKPFAKDIMTQPDQPTITSRLPTNNLAIGIPLATTTTS